MGVVISDDSAYAKELKKWDTPRRLGGYRPDEPQEFPKMLYRAFKDEGGKVRSYEINPKTGDPFTGTTLTVNSEDEQRRAQGQGWIVGTPKDAVDAFEKQEQALGNAAAEANAAAKSEKAKAELDAANALTMSHVSDVTPASKKALKERAKDGLN